MDNNWQEGFENREYERFEKNLNEKLNGLLDELDNTADEYKRRGLLRQIVEIYKEMAEHYIEYDEEDYIKKKEELKKLIDKIMYNQHNSTTESESWQEFEEEERRQDMKEEEDLER